MARWLMNVYDPRRPDARQQVICRYGETGAEAWRRFQEFICGKTIGRPRASIRFTVEEMETMHLVGVYLSDEEVPC